MKFSCLKYKDDKNSFKLLKNFGFDLFILEDAEKVDDKIDELIKSNYKTIVITNEVASFSEDINKKYKRQKQANIIITPGRNE